MKLSLRLVAGALCILSPGSVAASSCAKEIASLRRHIRDEATSAISTSTDSKAVSASREAKAIDARDKGEPVPSPPSAPATGGPEAEALKQAEAAGAGGDRVMQAQAILNHARMLDRQGNSTACMEAVAEAKLRLDH